MYVRRWPRISASSRTPPKDARTNLRFIALAIDEANDVLPTPGGPTKQRMEPLFLPVNLRTAKNSKIRFLTFSKP